MNPQNLVEGYLVIWGCGQTKPAAGYGWVLLKCSPAGVNDESPFRVPGVRLA